MKPGLRNSILGALIFAMYGTSPLRAEPADDACPAFANPIARGRIASKKIDEASGVAASRRNPGVYYVHNDSGDPARIFAIDESGRDLGRYVLDGVIAEDWEDIAVGPAPDSMGSFIFVGDIGDNQFERATIEVVRVPEPTVSLGREVGRQILPGAVVLSMRYPDGNAHNAETLLVDPDNGDLYVVTKVGRGPSRLFRNPAPHDPAKVGVLEEVGSFEVGSHPLGKANMVTGGDISLVRNQIVLRTYSQVLVWKRKPSQSLAQTLSRPPCSTTDHSEPQGEAVGWTLDGLGWITVSEGSKQPVYLSSSPE